MGNIGKYRLEEEIGRGGFGQVYRALDPAMGRMVAIKILLSQKDKDQLARFKNEANATGKLRHKNIVTVYDYGEYENKPYLVMEYLEGEDLQMIQASGRSLTLLEKTSIVSQLAEGLQHAHHSGVVHRDVKPANVMILKDGTAKIMDFGIARALVEPRLTQHGNLLGTLSYMAPEVFQGTDVDHLCDIFSVGVIFYELLTGKHPFAAELPGRVIYNITSVNPPGAQTLIGDVPPGMDELIARAIHKDRELRYQSMDDLLLDLVPIRLQLQAKEARALIQKAETLLGSQQIQSAQDVLRQALLLDPNNKSARDLREKISREANRQLMRDRCDQLMASAREHYADERYEKALEVLDSLVRLDPDRSDAQTLMDQARAAQRKRDRVAALIAQARRELEEEQLTGAYKSILECFQHAPENREAAALLETIRTSIERRERERRLAESLAKVQAHIAAGEPEEAESLLADLEMNYPAASQVRQLASDVRQAIREKKRRQELANALESVRGVLNERRWQEAVTTLERLSKQFPDEPEVRSLAAYAEEELQAQKKADYIERVGRESRAACDSKEFDRALKLLKSALETYPKESAFEAMLERTTQLRNQFQLQQAIKAAREKAEGFAAAQDFPAALNVLDRVLQTSDSSDLRDLRSRIVSQRDAYERAQAINRARMAVEALLGQNNFKEASAVAQKALSEFPGEPSLVSAAETVRVREAEHQRKLRIAAVADEASKLAKEQQFASALKLLDDALREFAGDTSLLTLRQRVFSEEQEHQRKALAQSANSIKERIERREYQKAIDAGNEALRRFQGHTIIEGLLNVAEMALAEERRAVQISKVCSDAEALAAKHDYDAALNLLRDTQHSLGFDPSLEELEERLEKERERYLREQAISALVAEAKEVSSSGNRAKAISVLEKGQSQYGGHASIDQLLNQLRQEEARSKEIDALVGNIRQQLKAQKLEAALNAVRSGLEKYSTDPRLTELAAEIKTAIGEQDRQRAIRGASQSAAALEQQGHLTGAVQVLEQALAKAPGEQGLTKELERIQRKIAHQTEIDNVLDAARDLLSREKLDEAMQMLQDALSKNQGEPALSSLLEEVRKKKRAEAIKAAINRIEAERSAGDLDGATRSLDKTLSLYPEEASILAAKTRIDADLAERLKKQKIAATGAEAQKLLDQQKVEDAKKVAEAGLKEFPNDPDLKTLLAYANEIIGARRRADAISELARKAKKLIQSGKVGEAEKLLKEAVAEYPGEESLAVLADAAKAAIAALETSQKVRKIIESSEAHRRKKRWADALSVVDAGLKEHGQDAGLQQEREKIIAEKEEVVRAEAAKAAAKAGAESAGVTRILTPGSEGFPKPEDTVVVSRSEITQTDIPKPEVKTEAKREPTVVTKPKEAAKKADRQETRKLDEVAQPGRQPSPSLPPVEAARKSNSALIAVAALLIIGVGLGLAYVAMSNWGSSDSDQATTTTPTSPPQAPALAGKIVQFYAEPQSVPVGGTISICYGVENAERLRIEPAIAVITPSPNRCFDHQPQQTQDYKLTVTGPDGVEVSQTVTVGVESKPVTEVGRLTVATGESGADVTIGIRKFRTGSNGSVEIPLDPGNHRVSAEKDGFEAPRQQTANIVAGKEITLRFILKPKPTRLYLSGAAGATVLLDGRSLGVIPDVGRLTTDTTPGPHTLTIRKEGFQDKSLTIITELGKTRDVTAQELALEPVLKPAAPPVAAAPPPAPSSKPPAPPEPSPSERAWSMVQGSNDISDFENIRKTYPGTKEAALASDRIKILEDAARARKELSDEQNKRETERLQAEATAQRRAAEIQAIRDVLERYSTFYAKKDLAGIQGLFQSMSAQYRSGLERVFRENRTIHSYLLRPTSDPVIKGDVAEVNCLEDQQLERTAGRKEAFSDPRTVTLRKVNGIWKIQSIQ